MFVVATFLGWLVATLLLVAVAGWACTLRCDMAQTWFWLFGVMAGVCGTWVFCLADLLARVSTSRDEWMRLAEKRLDDGRATGLELREARDKCRLLEQDVERLEETLEEEIARRMALEVPHSDTGVDT